MKRIAGRLHPLAHLQERIGRVGPFVTWRSWRQGGSRFIWRARDHRKGLAPADRGEERLGVPLWRTRGYNQLIGLLFAIGGALFATGSALLLLPSGDAPFSTRTVNIIFFIGSAPFTLAAGLQHFQSANAVSFAPPGGTAAPRRIALLGWQPASPGWLSTIAQLAGTIAFNFNTGDAISPPAGWVAENLVIWLPDFAGSILFLVSGYLAFIECGHARWSWRPGDLSWRLVAVNLAGCIFFMISAFLSWFPDGPAPDWMTWSSSFWLLLGSLGFLAGGVLTVQEAGLAPTTAGV